MTHDEQRIRERAYQLWESEGCPEGQAMRHWHEACQQIQAEDGASSRTSEETLETASGGVESGVAPPMPDTQTAT